MNPANKKYNEYIDVLNIVKEKIKKYSNRFVEMPTLDNL